MTIEFSIYQGDNDQATPIYIERHETTTNSNGLINVEIGRGTYVDGIYERVNGINWGDGPFLSVYRQISPELVLLGWLNHLSRVFLLRSLLV